MEYKLKSGSFFEIDESDFLLTSSFKLGIMKRSDRKGFYVKCEDKKTRKYVGLLHRILLNVEDRNIVVDHIDNNGLNNRRSNLRLATYVQNQQNRHSSINEIPGVFFRKDRNKWASKITVNKKLINLGHFDTFEEAKIERLKAEKQFFGEFSGNPEVLSAEW